jgi:hypothetical protein
MASIIKKIVAPHKNISLSDGVWINLIIIAGLVGFVLGWIFCYEKFYNLTDYVDLSATTCHLPILI